MFPFLGDASRLALDILLVLRVLRLVKLAEGYQGFHIINKTIVNLVPAISTYGSILLVSLEN